MTVHRLLTVQKLHSSTLLIPPSGRIGDCFMRSHGGPLIAFLFILNFTLASSDTSWDCSPVFDSCPSNGLLMALGPLQNVNVSLAYPDPLLQLPTLWSTKADFSLSGWFRAFCPNGKTCYNSIASCWLDWNATTSDGPPSLSYTFDTNKNQVAIAFKFLSCQVAATLPSTVGYWTLISFSFGMVSNSVYSMKIWSNTTLFATYMLSCLSLRSRPVTPASVLFSSNSTAYAAVFNLRIFDTAIPDTTVRSLFLQSPNSTSNSAFVANSNWRYYLAPDDPLRASRDMNSANGRLLATGPLMARYDVVHEYSQGPISLSYFSLFLRINVDNAPAVTQDSYIPIYSIVFADGHSLTLWWERNVVDSTARSSLLVVIAPKDADSICPESARVALANSLPITTTSWHTVSVSGLLSAPLTTTLSFTVDTNTNTQVVLSSDGFQPAVFMSTPDYRKLNTCKKAIPRPEAFRILLSTIRFKNESMTSTVSTLAVSRVNQLDSTSFCNLGTNTDSVQFPPPPCSGHGNYSSATGSCDCYGPRFAPSCRKCIPGAVVIESNTGDPFGQCYCPIGTSIQPSQCTSCNPGYFNGQINGNCSQCAPGTFSSQPGSSKCDICPSGTYSGSGQSSCISCPIGSYSGPRSSACSLCPTGNVPTTDSSSCQSCTPGKFANVTQCSNCDLGTASNVYNASACALCNPGQFSNTTGLYGCYSCPMGRFSSIPGSKGCIRCQPGFFSQQIGQATCTACDLGRFSNSLGSTSCALCPRGTYADQPKSTSCTLCSPGRVAPDLGFRTCLPCDPGRYANSSGLTQCNLCQRGYFAANLSSVSCSMCPPGSYTNISGSSICTQCDPGKFSNISGSFQCMTCPKGMSSPSGAALCSRCPPGFFSTDPGSPICLQCAPGRFSNVSGSSQCFPCPPGSSAPNPGSASCPPCNPGFFGNVSGSSRCLACPSGSFSNYPGALLCRLCSKGTIASNQGSSICSACPLGSIAKDLGLSSCTPCQPGSFANETGSSVCSPCALGTYTMDSQSSACSPCQPGSVAAASGSSSCQQCKAGSVAIAGQSSCTDCPAGTFAEISKCTLCPDTTISSKLSQRCTPCPEGSISSSDHTECLQCDPGRYVPLNTNVCLPCASGAVSERGKSTCRFCTAGTYANVTCVPCPSGTISADRALNCTPCRNGTQPDPIQSSCVDCKPGFFSEDGLRCSPCPAGRFARGPGAVACMPCDTWLVAGVGSSSCSRCTSGTGPSADNSTCLPCQAGWFSDNSTKGICAACSPGSYNLKLGQMACDTCPIGRYSNVSARAVECTSCSLTSFTSSSGSLECQPCQANSAVLDPSSAISQLSCLCAKGFFHNITANTNGFVCDVCPDGFKCDTSGVIEPLTVQAGYFVNVDDDRYVAFKCDPAEACLSSSGSTTKCAPLYTGFRCSSCINGVSYRLQQKCLQCETNFLGIVLMAFAALGFCGAFLVFAKPTKTPLSAIGLCLSNIQLIAVFATSLTTNWTPEIQALWQIFSILNFNIELFRPECAVHMSFWTKQFLKLLLPVISFWILLILSSIYYIIRRFVSNSGSLSSMMDRVIFASNLVLLYGYTLLVSTAADAFRCEDAGRGQFYLKGEPSVSCISDEYKSNILSSYIAIGVYGVGIPVSFSLLLWYRYKTKTLLSESFINRFGELTSPYKPGFFFWEIVNMIRRLLIIITINLVKGKFAQLFLLLALLFLTLLLHSFFNPYKSLEENRLATLWNLVTILVLFSAAILDSSDTITGPNEHERKTLTIMVFIGLAWTVAYTLKCLITELESRKKALLALVEKKATSRPKARKKRSQLSKSGGTVQRIRGLKNLAKSMDSVPSTERLSPSQEKLQFFAPHSDRQ